MSEIHTEHGDLHTGDYRIVSGVDAKFFDGEYVYDARYSSDGAWWPVTKNLVYYMGRPIEPQLMDEWVAEGKATVKAD